MELSEQEKERIVAEEKLRHETRKQMMKESCGGWHGRCHRFGVLKVLALVLILGAIFWHPWRYHHGNCGWDKPPVQSAPADAAPKS